MMKKDFQSEQAKMLEALIGDAEKELRLRIRRSQTEEAVKVFYELFDRLCAILGDQPVQIKGRVVELLVWISRSLADIGGHSEDYHLHNALIYAELYAIEDPQTIRKWVPKVIEHYTAVIKEAERDNTLQSVYTVSEYIQNHFKEKITIEDIAATVHLNGSYTSHLFRKTFGYTITDYITYIRLEHAKMMLADPQSNINDAATESGFSDVSYFSRVFKKIEGVSPREYRNHLRK